MEMAGIVCLTGAKIIQLARQRVEQIGRPLELDTDGIWCVLPRSFPENVTFRLRGGKTYTISYPCVMLNHLVHDQFTNTQYHEWSEEKQEYITKSENSIFFEVDGPYRAMILPASTEADKLLKKRYAVFNHDGTLAELKGFEVKRRGELKLIKNFQSSIFKVFLEGTTLHECYAAVADVSNRWIDILHSKGSDLSDVELFDLVSENRSMSKSLEQYGSQKSTSITTAKRLAEFLGQQMVQDRGLNCKFIISAKPNGAPVSERAVPVAIFQSEPSVKRHFLRKWLKDNSYQDEDIRELIDWDYYLERFGSVIQKLITIPAAAQDVPNPIPRIPHPDWLLKRLAIRDSKVKQLRITDLFQPKDKNEESRSDSDNDIENRDPAEDNVDEAILVDMEDVLKPPSRLPNGKRRIASRQYLKRQQEEPLMPSKKRKKIKMKKGKVITNGENPFDPFNNYVKWMLAQQPIWERKLRQKRKLGVLRSGDGIASFFKNSAAVLGTETWELLQLAETDSQGIYRLWMIVNGTIEYVDVDVPRIIYLNSTVPDPNEDVVRPGLEMTKRVRTLPRNHTCLQLYELKMTEYYYRTHANAFSAMFNHKDVEGVYETQVPLQFRALISLGLFAKLNIPLEMFDKTRPVHLDHLTTCKKPVHSYLKSGSFQVIYIFHASASSRHLVGTFCPATRRIMVFVVDPGRNLDQLPSVRKAYAEVFEKFEKSPNDIFEYPSVIEPKSSVVGTEAEALQALNEYLLGTKSGKPTILLLQSSSTLQYYRKSGVAAFREFPSMVVPTHKADNEFPGLGWQQYAMNRMINNCFNLVSFLADRIEIARYGNLPLCNIEPDYIVFLADLMLARRLKESDTLLWCSSSSKPDLGGSEQEDYSFNDFRFPEINHPGAYETVTIQLDLFDLPLNTLLRAAEFKGDLDNAASLSHKASIHLLDAHFSKVISRTSFTDVENPSTALSFIRALTKDWLKEVRGQSAIASTFLDHLHRWISSTSSLLYDPMILSHVHNMMKRSFAQLLEELQRLGSKIVYATSNKIILNTSKTNVQSSVGYIQYLIAAIQKNQSFEHIELKPSGFWDYLFWYDPFNYGGLSYQIENGNMIGDIIPDLRSNMSDYLPPLVQNRFLQSVAEYLYAIQQAKQNMDTFHDTIRLFVDTTMKRKLLQLVDDFHHRRIPENTEENPYTFPKLPGQVEVLHNPALEFVKAIVAVLSLDTYLEEQVRSLNRDLLRLIDLTEFSNDAIFHHHEKFVLSQVICEYCNFCCDLDLTKRMDDIRCHGCGNPYSKEDIELLLIDRLQEMITKWQLQDIQCVSCRYVRAEELYEVCARCTGKISTVYDVEQYKKTLRILEHIGKSYRMENLVELFEYINKK
jgi:DNA polymerase epsilon subunit 1